MFTIITTLFTVILILVSLFMILIILLQRANTNAGLGTAFGGGAAESAFGTETGNILTKGTIYASIAFFVICFGLYLGYMSKDTNRKDLMLPDVKIEESAKNTSDADSQSTTLPELQLDDVSENLTESVSKVVTPDPAEKLDKAIPDSLPPVKESDPKSN